ncbi:MAG: hypothetical protein JOS17DRAFT_747701 [Linnemannia elongata]|nr:MAG: hypothetical protein JOS17DRAFT_747701 [Linnemannia elongata]
MDGHFNASTFSVLYFFRILHRSTLTVASASPLFPTCLLTTDTIAFPYRLLFMFTTMAHVKLLTINCAACSFLCLLTLSHLHVIPLVLVVVHWSFDLAYQ